MSRRRRRRGGSREEALVTVAVLLIFVLILVPAVRLPALALVIAAGVAFLVSRSRAPSPVPSNIPASLLPLPAAPAGRQQQHAVSSGPDFTAYRVRHEFFWWSEAAFYQVLSEAVSGRYVIFAKVRLLDICDVPSRDYAAQNRIDKKHVDFLLCDANTFRPAVAIELDGSSHQRRDRAESDAFKDDLFSFIGIPLLRFKAERHDPEDVLRRIERATGRGSLVITPN